MVVAAFLRTNPGLGLVGAGLADGVARRSFTELEFAMESLLGVPFVKSDNGSRDIGERRRLMGGPNAIFSLQLSPT